jgi:hypothetical protein
MGNVLYSKSAVQLRKPDPCLLFLLTHISPIKDRQLPLSEPAFLLSSMHEWKLLFKANGFCHRKPIFLNAYRQSTTLSQIHQPAHLIEKTSAAPDPMGLAIGFPMWLVRFAHLWLWPGNRSRVELGQEEHDDIAMPQPTPT